MREKTTRRKYIIQAVPLIRLPIARTQVFSYLSDEPIEHGSLVEIPFYNRLILGIALKSQNEFPQKGSFRLKKIRKVVKKALLSEKQIRFAEALSEYYLSSLGTVLKFMMVPKIAKAKRQKKIHLKLKTIRTNKIAGEVIRTKDREIALIGSKLERDEIVFSVMQSALQKNKQCLYLTSEIFPAVAFFERLKSLFSVEEIAIIHGNISKGELYESWDAIRKGKVKIIVATKTGVFSPFRELGAIIVEEPGDFSHKQWDMNPRYNAAHAAQMLANIHEAKLIYLNSFLPVELWKKETKTFDLNMNEASGPEVKIANIFQEKKSSDFPVGKELYGWLSKSINRKERTLLIVNRRGFSTYSICRSCKAVLRCPDCNRALVYFEEREKYKCLHCSHKTDLLSACPTCGACQFSHQGVGIQLVEKKVKRLFPSARVLRLDADVSKSKKRIEKILKDLADGNFDVLIGTQIALKLGGIQKFYLVAFPSFEDLGSIPDFNTREMVYVMLNQARGLVENDGVIIIQTTYSDDFLLATFRDQRNKTFFEREIKERKKMGYPPFSRLVKIFYRDRNKKRVDVEINKVFNLIAAFRDSNIIEISEPYAPFAEKKRGSYYKNILIKFKPRANVRKSPVFSVLGRLQKGWTIDVDPISTV